MAQLPCWFEDYNENVPHKALWKLSPRKTWSVRFSGGNSNAEIEKKYRIDDGFKRLARAYQGREFERAAGSERSKGVTR